MWLIGTVNRSLDVSYYQIFLVLFGRNDLFTGENLIGDINSLRNYNYVGYK